MKHSIKKQMAAAFIGIVLFILLSCFFINGQFLEDYYIHNKVHTLEEIYHKIDDQLSNDKRLTEDQLNEAIGPILEKSNVALLAIDTEGKVKIRMRTAEENEALKTRLIGYIFEKNQKDSALLDESRTYEMRKAKDYANQLEYIEMWGYFSNGDVFIIRSPLESIRESVHLSNQFLWYIGIIVIFMSILIVWYLSNKITEPILELATLSQRMANLDFEAKYKSGGKNEIGILGENFNRMSEKLETTISELKSANFTLQKDIEKKEQIEQMRTEFLGNVSHELKTPIALIQGYAEGLKEGISDDPESREFYCDVIMDEANKMNQLVKNLLTLNQLEFGNEESVFERFDIVALIRGVLQSIDILVQQKNVTVDFKNEDPVYVWADEFKAEQVVRNYISNALNHVGNEKIIKITVQKNEEKEVARISVFNTGLPIPPEDIDYIWDKFYKVDKARTREYGGNGIGLSIVKAIMEGFHNDYGVKNYNNGVEFWMELDLK